MNGTDHNTHDRVEYRGRLSFTTFVKVCFVGVVGYSVLTGLIYLLVVAVGMAFSSNTPSESFRPQLPLIKSWWFVLLGVLQMLASAALTGVIGYPIYLWLAKVRGGLTHSLISNAGEKRMDWRVFARIYRRGVIFIPLFLIISLAASLAALRYRSPYYAATSTILLSQGDDSAKQSTPEYGDYVDTQLRILMSHTLTASAKNSLSNSAEDISLMLREIHAQRIGRSPVLKIGVESTHADFSALLANALVDEFIEYKSGDAGTVTVLERAVPPIAPSGPTTHTFIILSIIAGISLGFVISLLIATFRYAQETKPKTQGMS